MVKNKRNSILRINYFSDSESEEDKDEDTEEENMEISENPEETADTKNSSESENPSASEESEEEGEANGQVTQRIVKPKKIVPKKTGKKGIIYISQIPKHMNVTLIRELLENFGEVGRIYLQPDNKSKEQAKTSKKKRVINFTEGWVEFEKKKVAKWVAQNVNNTPISSKKGSIFCDILWSLKYLPRFKWIHLSERLTYERAVQRQKMQMAISKARKEANVYQNNLDKSEKLKKKKRVK